MTDQLHSCNKRDKHKAQLKEAGVMAGFTLLAVAMFGLLQMGVSL